MISSLKKQKRKIKQCDCLYEGVEYFPSLSTIVCFQGQTVPLYCVFKHIINCIRVFVYKMYVQLSINSFEGFLQQKCIKTWNVLHAYKLMMCFCGANRDFWIDCIKWSLSHFPRLIMEESIWWDWTKRNKQLVTN